MECQVRWFLSQKIIQLCILVRYGGYVSNFNLAQVVDGHITMTVCVVANLLFLYLHRKQWRLLTAI